MQMIMLETLRKIAYVFVKDSTYRYNWEESKEYIFYEVGKRESLKYEEYILRPLGFDQALTVGKATKEGHLKQCGKCPDTILKEWQLQQVSTQVPT